jgi:flagellar hook-associated protein 2
MSMSTNLVSGLVSGFDWRSMIDQLMEIEHRRVDLIEDKKSEYESKLTEWQSVNTMLLSLKTAAGALSAESTFNKFTASTTSNTSTSASNLFTVSTTSSASPATYNITVNNVAQSEKISSQNYSATDTALGLEGDILVSGTVVNVVSTDTLADIKDKINALNTGTDPSNVTASIITYASDNYHLVLTSDETGEDGLSVLEAAYSGGDNILQEMGFISSSTTIKTTTSDGAKSDCFTSSNGVVATLLDLSNAPGATTVQIGGQDVDIDLSAESITTIAQNIDALTGVSASVVSETVDGETRYRIDISGTTSFTDSGNVLQTLGILEGTYGTVSEIHTGDEVNWADETQSNEITDATAWEDIYDGDGNNREVVNNDTITISGTGHDGSTVSGTFTITDKTVAIDDAGNSFLTAIEDAFTAAGSNVSASIVDGAIKITDNDSGDSQVSLSLICNNEGGGTLNFGEISMTTEGRSMQLAEGEDAEIVVDNVTITDSSNTITDVIDGATLNLVGEDTDTTVAVKVDRDLDTIKSEISNMVDAYNDIMGYINTQFSYDEESEEVGGVLFGDGTLSSVKSDLINTVVETVTGLSSDYNRLSLIGISLDLTNTEEGKYDELTLSIDEDELTDALETSFNDVKKLFIADGSSPNPNMEYISHTDDTVGGTYDVEITQAATRTTVTGSTALGGTLDEAVDVTITDYNTGRQAEVSLTSDMDIDDVINAINSEFNEEHTEQLQGSESTGKTTSTLFGDITGADDGDIITLSGTKRNGLSVSGSYTVDTTETVGDLLEAVEDMFEDEVTASLDAGGKLIITDKWAGDSRLSFSIDTSSIDDLDFGTVSTSTEGRYAMPITASEGTDADDDKLVLTHTSYGTGKIIVVEQSSTTDPLGLDDVVQVYGKDVAGTINGVSATGSGRSLAVDSDGNNADGLSISYKGTVTTTTTFTLTLGIAELLDRELGFITDTSDGYVTYKQESLENRIDDFEDQIEEMEARLNRKMENMINRFVAMETALSTIQNQSDWLTGQLNASFSGWGWV